MDRLIEYWKEERAKLFRIITHIKAGKKSGASGKSDALATETSRRRALRGIEQYNVVIAKYS
jgi:hypothetical protein